jgi:hypothetical protein
MDGSTASLIAIPIVVTLSLAAWLILVAYAAAHPRWKHGAPATRADGQRTPHGGPDPGRRRPRRRRGRARQARGLNRVARL